MKTILLVLMLAFAPAFVGCKATPQQIAFNSTQGVVQSVDIAMKEWYRWLVAEERRNAALPAIEQGGRRAELIRKDGRVREAFARYQAAMGGVEAVAMATGQIPPDASQAASALVNLVKEFKR